jgi:hypothetical protein
VLRPFFLSFLVLLLGLATLGYSQKTGSDTLKKKDFFAFLKKKQTDDSVSTKWLNADSAHTKKHSPTKATLYSMALPGLGQAYNRQYWKMPVIYGLGWVLISQVWVNHQDWEKAERNLDIRMVNERDTAYTRRGVAKEYDYYDIRNRSLEPKSTEQLRLQRDSYRRDRDFYAIMTVLVYTLNVIDATVFAHLRQFELSEKVTLNIDPNIQFHPYQNVPYAGLTCKLTFR